VLVFVFNTVYVLRIYNSKLGRGGIPLAIFINTIL